MADEWKDAQRRLYGDEIIAERDTEIAVLKKGLHDACEIAKEFDRRSETTKQELQQLRAQVAAYGSHEATCNSLRRRSGKLGAYSCSCGFGTDEPLRVVHRLLRAIEAATPELVDTSMRAGVMVEVADSYTQAVALFGRPEKEVAG